MSKKTQDQKTIEVGPGSNNSNGRQPTRIKVEENWVRIRSAESMSPGSDEGDEVNIIPTYYLDLPAELMIEVTAKTARFHVKVGDETLFETELTPKMMEITAKHYPNQIERINSLELEEKVPRIVLFNYMKACADMKKLLAESREFGEPENAPRELLEEFARIDAEIDKNREKMYRSKSKDVSFSETPHCWYIREGNNESEEELVN